MSVGVVLPRPSRFSIGRTLGESIVVFARNAFWLVPVACATRAVVLLAPGRAEGDGSTAWLGLALDKLTDWLASSLADAVIILVILQILMGQRRSIGHLTGGFRFVGSMMVAYAIGSLPWTILTVVEQIWRSDGIESLARWFIIYVIATALYVFWCIATQAIVIDRIGPLAGLARSARLTKSRRWAVFGLVIIPSVAFIVLAVSGKILLDLLTTNEWIVDSIGYLAGATSTAYFAVLTTILYYDLRREKEGVESGEIAHVFD